MKKFIIASFFLSAMALGQECTLTCSQWGMPYDPMYDWMDKEEGQCGKGFCLLGDTGPDGCLEAKDLGKTAKGICWEVPPPPME